MRHLHKNLLIFSMLCAALLGACGGGGTGASSSDTTPITFSQGPKPAVTPDVTALGDCNVLPGQWEFQDIATGIHISPPIVATSVFQKNFRKSWGGTTTAHAVWKFDAADEPVWNEGHTVHFGSGGSFTTRGMIHSINLSGTSANMTALVGTSDGLVIADVVRNDSKWQLNQQKTIDVMGPVRSIATTQLILERNGPHVPIVFVVAGDSVFISKLSDLRAGFGCIAVAYQAKDHPVDPKDPANKRTFRPVKVVAQHDYAAFLTASRLPEEFSNAAQFKSILQNEWTSFQSTAHLIDLARQTPVEPIIMTMGEFDRFFTSDIAMTDTAVYLYGSRYKSAKPTTLESGLAIYKVIVGTPVVTSWAAVPASIGGDFRMGRFDTNLADAYIRGMDRAARVEGFLSGPTQQKWSVWQEVLPFDYVRSVSYRLSHEKNKTDPKKEEWNDLSVEAPQFVPDGPTSLNWTQSLVYDIAYAATTSLINATATDVDFLDVNGNVVHQHVQDDERTVFPIFENSKDAEKKFPRIFHVGNFLFYVRHGNAGPTVHVFQDKILGDVDISKAGIDLVKNGPALIRFNVINVPKHECLVGSPMCTTTAIGAFENMKGDASSFRIDDIRMISNPNLPNMQHFVMLVHSWNGLRNNYRAVALQANLSLTDNSHRVMEIQGCSDLVDPGNNYSNNVSFGKPDDQSRFLGPLTAKLNPNGDITYSGYFQHFSPTYNVWALKIDVSSQIMPDESTCKPAGEMVPLTDPALAESLSAVSSDNAILGLQGNGQVRWKLDNKTTQYLDVGANLLGGSVTLQGGHIVPAGSQYITQMNTTDGFHPTALFSLDGSSGESCPTCQFTDIAATGTTIFTAHPERGIELFEFKH